MTQPSVGFQQLPGVGLQQMPPGLRNMDNIVAGRGIFQQMNSKRVVQEIDQTLSFQRQGDLYLRDWVRVIGDEPLSPRVGVVGQSGKRGVQVSNLGQ